MSTEVPEYNFVDKICLQLHLNCLAHQNEDDKVHGGGGEEVHGEDKEQEDGRFMYWFRVEEDIPVTCRTH